MEHLIMYSADDDALKRIESGEKTSLIMAADSRKLPHGIVYKGDKLFFSIKENKVVRIILQGEAGEVFCSDRLTEEESKALISEYAEKYKLTDSDTSPCIGKTFITFIKVDRLKKLPSPIDLNYLKSEDKWLAIDSISELIR